MYQMQQGGTGESRSMYPQMGTMPKQTASESVQSGTMPSQMGVMPAQGGAMSGQTGAMPVQTGATDWSREITAPGMQADDAQRMYSDAGRPMNGLRVSDGRLPAGSRLDLRNGLPVDVITNPISVEEVYKGSLKALLAKYVGTYIVASFLVGTQNMVSWEGVLYDVGNDYVTIYQQGRDRYIVTDIYSLKFIEFYDTARREMCNRILENGQWQNGEW